MNHLYHGDCQEIIPKLDERIDCIFADPPDNIGLKYGEYQDKLPDEEYVNLLDQWLRLFINTAFVTWFSFNPKWIIKMGVIVDRLMGENADLVVKPCVQTFTFGQYNKNDFGVNQRPLWRFRRHDALFYPEQVKVPSWRQQHGDKRAKEGGRVPGDVFNYPLEPDVFDFTRVTGNAKQRRNWHPTQLHEGLVERCIKFCTVEGNTVCDPFAGTGTTLRVCERIGRSCITMDTDRDYCERISEENGIPIW
jgi:site-specific DNA-methyltransferase (adenine-specific)